MKKKKEGKERKRKGGRSMKNVKDADACQLHLAALLAFLWLLGRFAFFVQVIHQSTAKVISERFTA